MIRSETRSGMCRSCWDCYRAPPAVDAEMWRRAEAAVKLLRDGERDSEGLLAAVVWPTLWPDGRQADPMRHPE